MPSSFTPRQNEILEASLSVIDREGLKKFTMKNVAHEIGVTDAALYKHFADKAAILAALAAMFKTSTLDRLELLRNDPSLNALQKLEAFVKERAQQFQHNRALTVTLFSEELFRDLGAASSLNSDTMVSHAQQMVSIVRQGQQSGLIRGDLPPAHVVMLLTGPMRLMVTSWKGSPDTGPPLVDRVNAFWESFLMVIRPAAGP